MLFDNIALVAKRQTKESEFSSIYVVNTPINEGVFSIDPKGRESVFPLHAQPPSDGQLFGFDAGSTSNLNRESLSGHFQQESDVDIFHFAYAVFHSPGYRRRYAEFLKIDFPRLPLTGNLELFKALAKFGGELSALHLLESPKLTQLITEFIGGRHPEMEKVSWSANTIWIDKAKSIGFKGVPEDIWNFRIGGYQVCEKWLKDRKGRVLSEDDIAHYQKIVVALSETIRLMAEIDEVIEAHGGWPGAFVTGE